MHLARESTLCIQHTKKVRKCKKTYRNRKKKGSSTHNKLEPNTSKTTRTQASSKKKHTLYTAHPKSKEHARKHTETVRTKRKQDI